MAIRVILPHDAVPHGRDVPMGHHDVYVCPGSGVQASAYPLRPKYLCRRKPNGNFRFPMNPFLLRFTERPFGPREMDIPVFEMLMRSQLKMEMTFLYLMLIFSHLPLLLAEPLSSAVWF